jgi:hypothetical protein
VRRVTRKKAEETMVYVLLRCSDSMAISRNVVRKGMCAPAPTTAKRREYLVMGMGCEEYFDEGIVGQAR